MATFREKEMICGKCFTERGPYWHLFTNGKETPLIFHEKTDFVFAMNVVAQAALQCPNVHILTFELMSNHVHFLIEGEHEHVLAFFDYFKRKLIRGMAKEGHNEIPASFSADLKEITDLQALRNTIIYINRNGYVSDSNYHPFSYPWGANSFFYVNYAWHKTLDNYKDLEKRKMFRGRIPEIPLDTPILDGYIAPWSYCALEFAMSVFRDSHHYFSMLYRNVETYSCIAADIDDGEFLSDTEVYSQVLQFVKEYYKLSSIKELSTIQKRETAKRLHYYYRCSNEQIRRILTFSQYEIDELFPLSAK